MNLRNKKTGETIILKDEGELALLKLIEDSLPNGLNVWEEVKEPLIKDEKIRKAVRAWAEACLVERCHYDGDGDFATRWHGIKVDGSQIELDEGSYTIAELCGEVEE